MISFKGNTCIYACRVTTGKMADSIFGSALEGMKLVKSEEGEMLTKPFLDVCKNLLPVLGIQIY